MIALQAGDPAAALHHARASLARNVTIGDRRMTIDCLDTTALCLAALNRISEAATLFGSASSLLHHLHGRPSPYREALTGPAIARLRASLGNAEFEASWRQGEQLRLARLSSSPRATPAIPSQAIPGFRMMRPNCSTRALRHPHRDDS